MRRGRGSGLKLIGLVCTETDPALPQGRPQAQPAILPASPSGQTPPRIRLSTSPTNFNSAKMFPRLLAKAAPRAGVRAMSTSRAALSDSLSVVSTSD